MIPSSEGIILNEEFVRISNYKYNLNTNENEEFSRKKIINSDRFFNHLYNKLSLTEEILPLNCRYIKTLPNGEKIVITEDAPRIRTCVFNIDFERMIEQVKIEGNLERFGVENFLKDEKPYRLRLSLPYIVYMFIVDKYNSLRKVHMAFRLSPISSLYDYLLIPNLLNISNNRLEVCLGNSNKREGIPTLSETIDETINLFWSNPFNFDYTSNYNLYSYTYGISNFLTWAYYTKIDPLFIFKVKWKKYFSNLKEMIDMKQVNIKLNYNFIRSLITGTQREETKRGLFYNNVTNSIFLSRSIIEVGDQVSFQNGKNSYVEGFSIKNPKSLQDIEYKVTHLNLDFNNKIRKYKLTRKFKNFLDKQLYRNNSIESVILPSGGEIKNGDIVRFNIGGYKKVTNIRKSIDGMIEVKVGEYNYLLDKIDAKVLNLDNINLNDIKISQDKYYVIYNKNEDLLYEIIGDNYKFTGFDIENNDIIFTFCNVDNDVVEISNYSTKFGVVDSNKLEKTFNVIRYGTSFIKGDLFKTKEEILYKDSYTYATIDNLIESGCLSEDKFSIESYDLNIEFNIGDKVIVPNWNDPIDMLKIKKISKIRWDSQNLIFDIEDSKGKILSIAYYDDKKASIGMIRKICTEYKGISTGSKIRAKEVGICMFPKKDTNIIIGFITDTKTEPLVLCSNCCTIWFSDLINKFEIIPKTNKIYKKLKHAPINLDKIKPQIGDLIYYKYNVEDISIIGENERYGRRAFQNIYTLKDLFNNIIYTYRSQSHKKFYGILNPRYTQKQLSEKPLIRGFPDLHNSIIPKNNSKFYFLAK